MEIKINKFIVNQKIEIEDKEQELIAIIKDNPILKQELISYRQIDDTQYYVNGLGNIIKVIETETGLKSKPVKQSTLTPKGYKYITLKGNKLYVHRALAKVFLGLEDEEQVNHIDKNTSNNMIFNLERVTNAGNRNHSIRFDELVNSCGINEIDIFSYSYDLKTIIPLNEFKENGNVILYHY